jgi:hypothetical protein
VIHPVSPSWPDYVRPFLCAFKCGRVTQICTIKCLRVGQICTIKGTLYTVIYIH